jgi:hypothetical protein
VSAHGLHHPALLHGSIDEFLEYMVAVGGRGFWLARQLIDLLQIAPTGAGTSVRLHAVARASG